MSTFEAICIGDELLDGRVRDANAAAFGEFLALRGQSLSYVQFVRDDIDHICAGLRATTADVVVVTGGLGPTTDDRTREAAAAFSETELVFDEASFAAIRARFAERGREITSNNRRQAMFPAAATPLATSVGTAPGFTLQLGARLVFFFPGSRGNSAGSCRSTWRHT